MRNMKRTVTIILAALVLFAFACNTRPAGVGNGSALPTGEESALPTGTETYTPDATPVPDPADYVSPEFDAMRINNLEYGKDYVSLYERYGEGIRISDIREDSTTGLAYLSVDGGMLEVGLDFLSKAMINNTEPCAGFPTEDDVYAEWWRLYIQRWNYLMPEIPLYRDEYYCAYNTEIKGVKEYPMNPYFNQSRAVLYWESEKEDNSIILMSTSDAAGAFRYPEFGFASPSRSSNFDKMVCELTGDVRIVAETRDGGYKWNDTVVKSHEKTFDADGNTVYTVTLHDDLKFSDGSPIKAKDFLAMQLVVLSNVFEEASSISADGSAILGWSGEYETYTGGGGSGRALRGLRLLDEYTFSITIKKERSNYYDTELLSRFRAQYAPAWLNGFDIFDDGEGCRLSDGFYNKTDGIYDMEAHLTALCSEFTDEAMTKYPWSGAYKPVEVKLFEDAEPLNSHLVTLERNEYFKGNYEGVKPKIEKIVIKKVASARSAEEFVNKKIDLLTDITGGAATDEILKLCESKLKGEADTIHYSRAGYGKYDTRSDLGPMQFKEVRKALAYAINRDSFVSIFTAGYGITASAPYSVDSWMYKLAMKRGLVIDNYGAQRVLDAVPEKPKDGVAYSFAGSAEKATELLVNAGWIYDEHGGAYTSGVRYKRIPGDVIDEDDKNYASKDGKYRTVEIDGDYYMPLVINAILTYDGVFMDLPLMMLDDNDAIDACGIKVEHMFSEFYDMLNEWHQRDEYQYGSYGGVPMYNLFNLARGFNSCVYDYSGNFTIDPKEYDERSMHYLKDYADILFIGG